MGERIVINIIEQSLRSCDCRSIRHKLYLLIEGKQRLQVGVMRRDLGQRCPIGVTAPAHREFRRLRHAI
jgi:hypothetical protein